MTCRLLHTFTHLHFGTNFSFSVLDIVFFVLVVVIVLFLLLLLSPTLK